MAGIDVRRSLGAGKMIGGVQFNFKLTFTPYFNPNPKEHKQICETSFGFNDLDLEIIYIYIYVGLTW